MPPLFCFITLLTDLHVCACRVHLLGVEDDVAVLHLLVDGAVGEAAPADADALQHAVASQLVQHEP